MPRFSDLMREEIAKQQGSAQKEAQSVKPEAMEKLVAFLYQHQVRWIDQIARECKAKGGKQLWRGEVIRGLIEGLVGQNIDLSGVKDENDLAFRIRELFKP